MWLPCLSEHLLGDCSCQVAHVSRVRPALVLYNPRSRHGHSLPRMQYEHLLLASGAPSYWSQRSFFIYVVHTRIHVLHPRNPLQESHSTVVLCI